MGRPRYQADITRIMDAYALDDRDGQTGVTWWRIA